MHLIKRVLYRDLGRISSEPQHRCGQKWLFDSGNAKMHRMSLQRSNNPSALCQIGLGANQNRWTQSQQNYIHAEPRTVLNLSYAVRSARSENGSKIFPGRNGCDSIDCQVIIRCHISWCYPIFFTSPYNHLTYLGSIICRLYDACMSFALKNGFFFDEKSGYPGQVMELGKRTISKKAADAIPGLEQ